MPIQIRQVDRYTAAISDRAGEGARVLGILRDAGVNLIAVWGYPYGRGRARLEFIPEDSAAFIAAAKRANLKPSKKERVFCIQGEDRPGALAEVLDKLGAARISVSALQGASDGAGYFGAIVCLTPAGTRKAADVLGTT